MRMTLRAALAMAVVGLSLQASDAEAGLRHFRVFCPGCQPVYSAPVYVAMPAPSCACAAPMISYAPTCCQSSSIDLAGNPEAVNPYVGPSVSAYAPATVGAPIAPYGSVGVYGGGSYAAGAYGAYGYGGAGYGFPYAPMYSGIQFGAYTPVTIDFQDDLVW